MVFVPAAGYEVMKLAPAPLVALAFGADHEYVPVPPAAVTVAGALIATV